MPGEGAVRRAGIGNYKRINTATTTVIKAGPGTLYRIAVNTTAAGAITLYDNPTSGSGSVIGSLKSSIAEGIYVFGCYFKTGLTIVTAAASDITVIFE